MPAQRGILISQYLGRICHESFSTEQYFVTKCVASSLDHAPSVSSNVQW